ncbi:hypothetical protein VP01_154g7 [Puccinia sorghi]|uniref:Uncharacterized protein n=1 Tax=Puccinia sorghi TaxID=27349 RepID=A0A0L6VIC4_9BASI|nr:hypothetical protein VP01_154g7 [Puccinia sorghi]
MYSDEAIPNLSSPPTTPEVAAQVDHFVRLAMQNVINDNTVDAVALKKATLDMVKSSIQKIHYAEPGMLGGPQGWLARMEELGKAAEERDKRAENRAKEFDKKFKQLEKGMEKLEKGMEKLEKGMKQSINDMKDSIDRINYSLSRQAASAISLYPTQPQFTSSTSANSAQSRARTRSQSTLLGNNN